MSAREELAALILDHAGVAYGRGDAHCLCGELLWTLKDGFTVGPLAMTSGRAVGEIAHANHLANVLAKHDAEVGAKALTDAADAITCEPIPYGASFNSTTDYMAGRAHARLILIARATTTTEVGADG